MTQQATVSSDRRAQILRVDGPDGKWWIFNAIDLEAPLWDRAESSFSTRIGPALKRTARHFAARKKAVSTGTAAALDRENRHVDKKLRGRDRTPRRP